MVCSQKSLLPSLSCPFELFGRLGACFGRLLQLKTRSHIAPPPPPPPRVLGHHDHRSHHESHNPAELCKSLELLPGALSYEKGVVNDNGEPAGDLWAAELGM